MDTPRILITGAGGAAATVLIKHLQHADVFAGDIDPLAAGLYLVPADRRVLLNRADVPGFARHLLRFCRELDIEVIIPTVDAELLPLARMRRDFERHGIRLLLAPRRALETCLDKLALAHTVPDLSVRSAAYDDDFDVSSWRFPLIVKPRSGAGGRGVVKVDSAEALRRIPRDSRLMVQSYLPGAEYSVDVFVSQTGEVLAAVPRERLKVDSGVAVTCRTVRDSVLEARAREVATKVGLRGVANLQFRRDRCGTPRLIEINARFPGTMSLTIRAGVDMPGLWLREILGETHPSCPLQFSECTIVRTWSDHEVDSLLEPALARSA